MLVDNGKPLLNAEEMSLDEPINQFDDADNETAPSENGFFKIAIGILIGATLGGIAGALTNKSTVERVNQKVKGVGNSVKGAAVSVSETVKEVGNAVNSITLGVNETVKDVSSTVKGSADDVTDTVETTASTVKATAEDVSDTMKTTMDAVQNTANTIQRSSNLAQRSKPTPPLVGVTNGGTLYRLVPVDQDTTAK